MLGLTYDMNITPLQDSFNRGELSPKMFRRVDHEAFMDGVRTLTNFTTVPRGAAKRRVGFRFLGRVALPDSTTYVFPQRVDVRIATPTVEVTIA